MAVLARTSPFNDAPNFYKHYDDATGDIDCLADGPGGDGISSNDSGYPCWAFKVGTLGDVVVRPVGGASNGDDDVTIPEENLTANVLEVIQAEKILETGTTATDIMVYWRI